MFGNKRLAFSLAALGAGASLALGGPAAVADSGGAQVFEQSGCNTYDGGYVTECSTEHAEFNNATTPSGDASYEGNAKYDYTVTYTDGYTFTEAGSVHFHNLLKQGQPQEFSDHSSQTVTTNGHGTCTSSFDIHYANGQYQFDNFSYVCQ